MSYSIGFIITGGCLMFGALFLLWLVDRFTQIGNDPRWTLIVSALIAATFMAGLGTAVFGAVS